MDPRIMIEAARSANRTNLDERSGKALLAHFGVAVPRSVVVQAGEPLGASLSSLKPPFVVKVMSPEILHKSDVGGVRVRLQSVADVELAIRAMLESPAIGSKVIDGFLVEETAPAGQELVVGGLKDPQFGPLVMLGLGGIFVEVLKDVTFRICPIEPIDAQEMIEDLKGKALLEGARGQAAVSKQAIVDVLLKIGGEGGLLMTLQDDLAETDINPVIVSADGATAADARFILTREAA